MKIGMYRGRKKGKGIDQAQASQTGRGAKKPIAVEISIDETDLIAGDSVPIMATVMYQSGKNDQRVQWLSSNEAIVRVDKGKLIAENAGKAMIKAVSIANSGVNQSIVISVAENHVK